MSNFTYQAKPVFVEAFKISSLASEATQVLPQWLIIAMMAGTVLPEKCNTKQGWVIFSPTTDWLIHLDDGEIYPCSDEIFQKKYEKCPGVKDN